MASLVIRILFSVVAALATLFVLFYGMSLAVKPFVQRVERAQIEDVPDYELADMPEVDLPSASTPGMSLDTSGVRLRGEDESPAPSPLRGRWLAGPLSNAFQIEGRGRWLRLTGHTEPLWTLYENQRAIRIDARPEHPNDDDPNAASRDTTDPTEETLCFEIEVLGHLGARQTDEVVSSVTVEQVMGARILEVREAECLSE